MKLLHSIALITLTLSPFSLATGEGRSITEFEKGQNEVMDWRIVDDGVMGGLSKGKVSFTQAGTLRFAGTLSLENNGGFSSVRTSTVNLDLSDSAGLALRVKGDGRSYQLRLTTDARYGSGEVSFKADFPTTKGKWREVNVPFSKFVASWRGRTLKDKFNPAKIQRLGLLLGDKKAGPFELEVDWIRTLASDGLVSSSGDLVQTALADGRFKTLTTLLTKADLVSPLQGNGPLTVFAPTDAAFAKLPKKTIAELLEPDNREKLQNILKYHVVSGGAKLGDALKASSIQTLQGESVEMAFAGGKVLINDVITLIDADIECSNGFIHVIDSVLLPPEPEPQNILDVAEAAGKFGTLLTAIDAAGLRSVLDGEGPFTVFAPTDEAVAQLPEATVKSLLKENNRAQLQSILTYHVVGERISAGDALNAGSVKTVNGQTIEFAIRDGLFQVNDSTIRTTGLECSNGVIHIIDRVLLPPSQSPEDPTSKSTPKASLPLTAQDRILTAIDKGVPLYNNGDSKACADVYEDCVASLANDDQITGDVRKTLTMVLAKARATKSDDTRAWILRRTLDNTFSHLKP